MADIKKTDPLLAPSTATATNLVPPKLTDTPQTNTSLTASTTAAAQGSADKSRTNTSPTAGTNAAAQGSNDKTKGNAALPAGALKSILIFGSTGALVTLSLLLILPIAQVVVGRLYSKDCPINVSIPHYQVVAGSVTIVNILLAIILGVLSVAIIKPSMKAQTDDADAGIAASICCLMCGIFTILHALALFMIAWTIAGLVWVFGAWSKVQYNHPDQATYCHPVLYRFTYWLFFLPFIFGIALCCAPILLTCCACCAAKPKRLQRVPTSEP